MRIATWNVNSLRARLERVEEWLQQSEPDVCCFQETKLADDAFPSDRFQKLGYEVAHHGDGRWNGVAIASRVGLDDVASGFSGGEDAAERRLIAATCGGVRVMSVYVPNGRAVGTEHLRGEARVPARPAPAAGRDSRPGRAARGLRRLQRSRPPISTSSTRRSSSEPRTSPRRSGARSRTCSPSG